MMLRFGKDLFQSFSPLTLTSSLFQKSQKRNNLLCLYGPAATDKINANQCNYALFFHIVSSKTELLRTIQSYPPVIKTLTPQIPLIIICPLFVLFEISSCKSF